MIWSTTTFAQVRDFYVPKYVNGFAFMSQNGQVAFITQRAGQVHLRVWKLHPTKEILNIPLPFNGYSVAFAPDNELAAIGTGIKGDIALWDMSTMSTVATLQGHTERVDWLKFIQDGRLLLSRSEDGTMRVWGVKPGSEHNIPLLPVLSECPGHVSLDPSHFTVLGNYEQEGRDVVLYTNGEVSTRVNVHKRGSYTVSFTVKGSRAKGELSEVEFLVNGDIVGRRFLTKEWNTYQFKIQEETKALALSVRFVNDAWDPANNEDRNVWVREMGVECP